MPIHLGKALDLCKESKSKVNKSFFAIVVADLRHFYTFLRDTIKASQCAALLSECGFEPRERTMEFIASAYLHAGMNDLAEKMDSHSDLTDILIRIRSGCNGADLDTLIKDLYELVSAGQVEMESSEGKEDLEGNRWKVLLCCVALAEAEEKRGCIAEALFHTRRGVAICKSAIRNSGAKKWLGSLSELLASMGHLWGQLGDKRRAEGYIVAAGECLGLNMQTCKGAAHDERDLKLESLDPNEKGEESPLDMFDHSIEGNVSSSMCNEILVERVSKSLRLLAMPPEKTVDLTKATSFKTDLAKEVASTDIERNVEIVKFLIGQGDALRRVCDGFENGFSSKYERARDVLELMMDGKFGKLVEKEVGVVGNREASVRRLGSLKSSVDVRLARAMELAGDRNRESEALYESVRASVAAKGKDKAAACYRLGRRYLSEAKSAGELEKLWRSDVEELPMIRKARSMFCEASKVCGPGTSSLSRRIYRCLGLVGGAEGSFDGKPLGSLAAVINVHKSLGASSRVSVSHNIEEESSEETKEVFRVLDDQSLSLSEATSSAAALVKKFVPDDWNIASLAVCPTGEVLVASLRKVKGEVVAKISCIFGESEGGGADFVSRSFDTLDLLLGKSRRQLDGLDTATAKKFGEKEKREWWRERQSIDDGLKQLMIDVQRELFEANSIKSLLTGAGEREVDVVDNLSVKFDAACNVIDLTGEDDEEEEGGEEEEDDGLDLSEKDVKKMTVALLKENIAQRNAEVAIKGLRKAQLQEVLLDILERKRKRKEKATKVTGSSNSSSSSRTGSGTIGVNAGLGTTIVLVLDERLQKLPWESMPMLEKLSVCRVPSLPFAIAPVIDSKGETPKAKSGRCFYVLDPENNLPATNKTLGPVLDSYSRQKGWNWKGYVGKIPELSTLDRLEKEDGLMIYCGHGGAECCFPRADVEERLMKKRRGCRSSLFLFGCSSGRLSAGGGASRGIGGTFKQMEYEPDGVVTSYLCAGAPCVVGNLWDVSDRDIDRFCLEFLDKFTSGGKAVTACVSESRRVCKMRYIVGAAVVVYGVPIAFEKG